MKDLELLRFLVKKDYSGIEAYLHKHECDTKKFIDFTDKHRISGYLYIALAHSSLKNILPGELMANFKSSYIKQWVRNQLLYKEMVFLGDLFRESGQEVIFLKGLFLAQRYLGHVFGRDISDIDILVRDRKDIDNVHSLLTRHDFKRISRVLINTEATLRFTHHFEYRKEDIAVELHWLLQNHFTLRIDYETIWKNKQEYMFKEKTYYVLSHEYELVVQILSIFTDVQTGSIILKPFVDVYTILKKINVHIHWEDFFARRLKEGLFFISLNVLDAVLDILDCYDNFKELASYIGEHKKHLRYNDIDRKLELLNASGFGLKNKPWAFSLYQTSLFNSICWWAVSLPFRLIVYRKNK